MSLDLLPGLERAARREIRRRRLQVLSAVAVLVWLLVGALRVARLVAERRFLDREVATLQAPLAALMVARRAVHNVADAVRVVSRADHDRGRSLAILAAVTAALPDSAALTSFTWQADGPLVVVGVARQAGPVLAQLEHLGSGAPTFQGPVVREAVAGRLWDRFTITLRSDSPSRKRTP